MVHGGSALFSNQNDLNSYGVLIENNIVNDLAQRAVDMYGVLSHSLNGDNDIDTLTVTIKNNIFTGVTDINNSSDDGIYIYNRNLSSSSSDRYQRVIQVSDNVMNRAGQIKISGDSSNENVIVNVLDNQVYNSRNRALEISNAKGGKVSGNTFRGLYKQYSSYNDYESYVGVNLEYSSIDMVSNVVDSSFAGGVRYVRSVGRIDSNTITNNAYGLILTGTFENNMLATVRHNNLTNNSYYGIRTTEYSNPTLSLIHI